MSRQVADNRDQDVPALIGVAPLCELPHASLEHLIGVKTRILPQQRPSKRGDHGLRWMAQGEMAGNQAGCRIDLPLTIEAVEQCSTDGLRAGWQVSQPITLRTGQSRWW